METYTDCKPFVDTLHFKRDRGYILDNLDVGGIDLPLLPLVQKINRLPYVFSLQCCQGHFLRKNGKDIKTLDPLQIDQPVNYRLAYIALCIENSSPGRRLQQRLMNIPSFIDCDNVQFCSAQWFWNQWPNSYALQIMPERFKTFDSALITCTEAREIAKIRDACFAYLDDFVANISDQE